MYSKFHLDDLKTVEVLLLSLRHKHFLYGHIIITIKWAALWKSLVRPQFKSVMPYLHFIGIMYQVYKV